MNTKVVGAIVAFVTPLMIAVMPGQAGQKASTAQNGGKGTLELESNLSDVDLHCCPHNKFERKTERVFFGLFKAKKSVCLDPEISLGTTPIKPVMLPAGRYVLLLPPDHVWEHKGFAEFSIQANQKTFFSLKLFKRLTSPVEGDHAEGAAAAGAAGLAGTPPPPP